MGQLSYTQTVGDLVSATLLNTRQEVVDNIFRKSAYLAKMMSAGRKKADQGGHKIHRAVEYAVNGTVQSFQGYDVVPIVPQETVTDTQWDWKEYAGNWVISRREERLNAGSKTKIRDLAMQKKNSLERSFNQKLNEDILSYSTTVGNGGKSLTPLVSLVSLSSSLTVGGLAEASNSWWANQRQQSVQTNGGTQNGSAVLQDMRNFYNDCGQHNDGFCDFGIWGKLAVEAYESILDSKVRYGSTEMASMGFETVYLKGMEIAWDQIVPRTINNGAALVAYNDGTADEECCFFLNTDYLYLVVDSGTDFVFTPAVNHEPGGQYATSGSLLFMGEHICTNRRAQGLYYGFETTGIVLNS